MIEGMCVFLLWTKMIQISANCSNFLRKFVPTLYEVGMNFVITTFTVPMFQALWGRNSYEIRANFV